MSNFVEIAVLSIIGIGLGYAAAAARTPMTAPFRPWDSVIPSVIALLGMIWIVVSMFPIKRRMSMVFFLLFALFSYTIASVWTKEYTFSTAKQAVLRPPATTDDLWDIGQHFIVGYRSREEAMKLIESNAIGGLFITQRNIQGKTVEQIREEIDAFQKARKQTGKPPLIIATDQEGGIVSRMSPPLPWQPALNSLLTETNQENRNNAIVAYAKTQAEGLRSLGITVNFAPVVDLNWGRTDPADKYSKITTRAIGSDPQEVTDVALLYAQTLYAEGVMPTLKHFPGLGRVAADTHVAQAIITTAAQSLERADWVPFRTILAQTPALLMVGHAEVPAIDPGKPATLSYTLLTNIVRKTWGYDGVIITDDFSMAPIYYRNGSVGLAAVEALNAGVDIILIAYDTDLYYEAMSGARTGYKAGAIDKGKLHKSSARLSKLFTSSF